jgi:hypothetical protein
MKAKFFALTAAALAMAVFLGCAADDDPPALTEIPGDYQGKWKSTKNVLSDFADTGMELESATLTDALTVNAKSFSGSSTVTLVHDVALATGYNDLDTAGKAALLAATKEAFESMMFTVAVAGTKLTATIANPYAYTVKTVSQSGAALSINADVDAEGLTGNIDLTMTLAGTKLTIAAIGTNDPTEYTKA